MFCDGLKNYHSFSVAKGCTVRDVYKLLGEKSFFILNTINGFHRFIKHRYDFCCGVATKYLNRYNALFAASYNNAEDTVSIPYSAKAGSTDHYHRSRDV